MDKSNCSGRLNNAIVEIGKAIYDDVGHPILKEVGSVGESLMKFVALPFKFLGLTADQLERKYANFLEETISKVPKENIIIPSAVIAAPLLDHVKFVFNEDGLSEMFSNLLANAMNKNIEKMVHPAFVEVLKQMSPIDALFMHTFFLHEDIVEVEEIIWEKSDFQKSLAIDSLNRLGIIDTITYDGRDDVAIVLTSFGHLFRDLCMLPPLDIENLDYIYDPAYYDGNENGELFTYSDVFATAQLKGETLNIQQKFDYTSIEKGNEIVILLRISNISSSDIIIQKLFIDTGERRLFCVEKELPYIIKKGKYKDFVFRDSDIFKLLSMVINEKAQYVLQTEANYYDLTPTYNTKKEIAIFLDNVKRKETENGRI